MKNAKKSMILVVLSYPLAYVITFLGSVLSTLGEYLIVTTFTEETAQLVMQIFPDVGTSTKILSLVIGINVFAILLCGKNNYRT